VAAQPLTGYRRPDGRVGIRNHVLIIAVDDLSNAVAESVAKAVPGTLPLAHPYGRLQFGADLDLFFRTMIGTGANPNVAAAVVIAIERRGDLRILEMAARQAARLLQDASEISRVPAGRGELLMSIKCGESDTTSGLGANPATSQAVDRHIAAGGTVIFGETTELTGGEHLIAARCATDEVRKKFQAFYDEYVAMVERTGANLLGSQPTQGNIRGGLSTIEEKALGNIEKTGTAPVVDALAPGERPVVPGLNFMDTSCAAAEFITLTAAAGAVIHLFPTGQGNVVGHPVEPVLKISANPLTVTTMSEHIDLDVSGLLQLEYSLAVAGDRLEAIIDRTVNGRLTCAEALGHREFALTRLHPSA
jgi:(2R)-sulfolactate sulfo-lyase subunit beta